MTEQRDIWERNETDTDKSFSAFCVYRDMGAGRSLEEAWKQYRNNSKTVGKIQGYFFQWSTDHNWVERANAYDNYLEAKQRQVFEDRLISEQQQLIDNGLRDYRAQLALWNTRFEGLTRVGGLGIDYSDLMTLAKIRAEIEKLGRVALQMPDKYSHQQQEVNSTIQHTILSEMTDEELASIQDDD